MENNNAAAPRILLAEDNDINQEIARELLQDMNLTVIVAENGAQALEAATAEQFAIILMDIQMPVMDGLEATRRIRSGSMPWAATVPIIAMTAHSEGEDREHTRAAGMNDHLTKPIDPRALQRVVETWLPGHVDATGAAAEQTPPPPSQSLRDELQNLYGINAASGIANVAGNETLYLDLLNRFSVKYRDSHHELPDTLGRGDIESAARLAHTIKGVAANLGANHLADTAKKIEAALTVNTDITALLPPYAEELALVTRGIDQLIALRNQRTAPDTHDALPEAEALSGILDTLEALPMLMQTDWGQAQEKVEALGVLLAHTEVSDIYARLRNALEEFDVDTFAATAGEMAERLR